MSLSQRTAYRGGFLFLDKEKTALVAAFSECNTLITGDHPNMYTLGLLKTLEEW